MTNLKDIDIWSSKQYYDYYQKLMPFYDNWYNANDGYRPIAIGRNISWWLEKNEITRKCIRQKQCKNRTDNCSMVIKQFGEDKLSCWECSIPSDKKKKKALISPWERYYDIFHKILWNIEDVKKTDVLKTTRSLYWHNSIRKSTLKHVPTDKSWNETIASNFVLDIDIKDKHKNSIYDKETWNELYPLLSSLDTKLRDNDLDYKIMSSGNGIYIILKRIIYDTDKEDNETPEVFWNKISHGWREYINHDLQSIFENTKFNVDGEEPYTMKFYKAPFSMHQRLDISAIPLSLDLLSNMTNTEFKEISNPNHVINNWSELLKVWD